MIRIEDEIFLKKKFDFEKLKEFGFCFENNTYIYSEDFMDGDFKAVIEISDVLKGKAIDNFSNEEYMPLRIESFDGDFVCSVRKAYKDILKKLRIYVVQTYSLRMIKRIALRIGFFKLME